MEARSLSSQRALYARLGAMIFLEIAVLASYLPLLGVHLERRLAFGEQQVSNVYLARPLTSLVAPVLIGWIADRYVSAQVLLGIVSLVRAISLFWLARAHSYAEFVTAMSLMSFASWPAQVLMHSICFHHLTDARRFGPVRVWGTISWIIAVWAISAYMARQGDAHAQLAVTHHAFIFAGVLSGVLSIYAFSLPDTPPAPLTASNASLAGFGYGWSAMRGLADGFRLLANRNYAAVAISGLLGAVALPFVTVLLALFYTEHGTGLGLDFANGNRATSVSQGLELVLFPLLGLCIARLGLRTVLFIGLFAWPVRFAACIVGHPAWMVIAAQALHGFNFVFGFTGAKIAVDLVSPSELRTSAQALLSTLVDGVGSAAGFLLCGAVFARATLPHGGHDWGRIFLVPLVVSAVASATFLVLFRDPAGSHGSRRAKSRRESLDTERRANRHTAE